MKKIELNFEDKNYILEFDRAGVKRLEQNGFDINEVMNKPATMLPKLYKGAFAKNHPDVSEEKAVEIINNVPNKEEFIVALVELYTEPLNALMSNTDKGNASWKKTW